MPAQTAINGIKDLYNRKVAPFIVDAVNRAGIVLANNTIEVNSAVTRVPFVDETQQSRRTSEISEEEDGGREAKALVDDSWMDCDDGYMQLTF